jgi:hypothetical protein
VLPLYSPLSPCGELTGSVYLDENHDGEQGADERGIPDLHVALWRNGEQMNDGITGAAGAFRMRNLPAGPYELRIDPKWIPSGWVASGGGVMELVVVAGHRTSLPPCGVGPKQKPIIITYPGSKPRPPEQDAAPSIKTGGGSPEPGKPAAPDAAPGR